MAVFSSTGALGGIVVFSSAGVLGVYEGDAFLDHVLFSPSPLVQLAETPEEVVVSKD